MQTYFAVIPDGQSLPVALFQQLEDAIDWGMGTMGADKFSIRGVSGVASQWGASSGVLAGLAQGN